MRHILPWLLIASACGTAHSSFAAIVISADDTYAQVSVGFSVDYDQHINSGTGADANASFSLAHDSFTRSTFTPTVLHGSYVQRRPGEQGAVTLGYYSANFSVSANSTYQALGSYQNSDGLTHFHMHLDDLTTSGSLFVNEQVSDGGGNFLANQTMGNVSNILTGSAFGYLQAGHTYQWYALAYSQALSGPDPGAFALGSIALLVQELPEPTSVAVWLLLASVVSSVVYSKRTRTAD